MQVCVRTKEQYAPLFRHPPPQCRFGRLQRLGVGEPQTYNLITLGRRDFFPNALVSLQADVLVEGHACVCVSLCCSSNALADQNL